MLLKPKIVTKTSMVFKRFQHLYDNKKKVERAVQTSKMYKPFKEGYLHSQMYQTVFAKTQKDEEDPVTQALS